MNEDIRKLIDRIKSLEQELERELDQAQEELRVQYAERRVRFEQGLLDQHRRLKTGLLRYVFTAKPRHLLSAPFIYAVFPAFLLLDLLASLYQRVCFPLYRIPRVSRADYLVFDRHHLGYLNLLEKLHCAYCSYASGLLSYVKEIVSRTEQYWCPIRHARRVFDAHGRYGNFFAYGDAESYRRDLQKLRDQLHT